MERPSIRITQQIHLGTRYAVYRAIEEDGGQPVVLKMLKDPYPSAKELSRLRNEFALLSRVSHPNIIHAPSLEHLENRLALVREDIEGHTLQEAIRSQAIGMDDFFPIALQLAQAVQALHRQRIIHKKISSSNILVDPGNKQVKLAGFSLAAEMSREAMQPSVQDVFEAELEYISPEQTGRMNRNLDYRTDFYSMGVVFYEMLTGRPPFTSADPMELVHSHIALHPIEPAKVRKEVPRMLSKLVMKLLTKNEDERYQGANGLLYDLTRCEEQYRSGNTETEFELGQKDVSDQFHLPGKLYGRQSELQKLQQAYQQSSQGLTQVLMVAGYSGVGKSSLVNYLQKSIAEQDGFFVKGKFDQFKRDSPLSGLLGAFRALVRQLLTQNEQQISQWRNRLTESLAGNGQLIVDVVPDLELLIGPQAAVPELPPAESNNRFIEVFNRFVRVFCQTGHPLCIFLDDLQWIDSASRAWIETQVSDQSLGAFLLMGAYRDNEVSPSHPLMMMLDRLKHVGVALESIHLEPLDLDTITTLVADTLADQADHVRPLAGMIFQKTNGNPFFTRQCLLSLYENGAIYFDTASQRWQYDLQKAHEAEISDNVVDMMAQLIKGVPSDVQDCLKLAACIGNQFSLSTLATVGNEDLLLTQEKLHAAQQKGLIVPFNAWRKEFADEYTFLHDRVQQAALALLPEDEKKITRLKIGRLLLEHTENPEAADNLYDITDHLNYADKLIVDRTEQETLARLNLAAGIRARKASAYETARRYATLAMGKLPEQDWDTPSALTVSLYLERADSEHLCGAHDVAEQYYDKAIAHSRGMEEKTAAFQRKIHYYTNLRKFPEAYHTGREAVMPLGVKLPASFIPPLFVRDLAINRMFMLGKKVPDLIDLPEMTDPGMKLAIPLMASFARAAYQIRPELCVAICTKMANISLRKGNTDGSYIGYLALGPIFLGAILKMRQQGFDYGQVILSLVEKYKSTTYKAETHFVVGYFGMPWRRPAVEMEQYWQIAYEAGLQSGDFFHASCAACGTIQSYYMRGMNFDEILRASDRYMEFLQRIRNSEGILTQQAIRQSIRNLKGETLSPESYSCEGFDEAEYIREIEVFASRHFAHYYFINKMQTLYLWGAVEQAYAVSLQSDQYLKDSPGMMHTAEHFVYKGLILSALCGTTHADRNKHLRTLRGIVGKVKGYARGCADNFQHKALLLEAELCRVQGKDREAETAYNAALDAASRFGYLQIEALVNARLADFHAATGKRKLARLHLEDAIYAYESLGAGGYAKSLAQRYPTLRVSTTESGKTGHNAASTGQEEGQRLDLRTVLKSSEAISRQIRLHDLLSTMMRIIMENAGAQRMVLMLQRDNNLVVQGECTAGSEDAMNLEELPFETYEGLPKSIVHYVMRTRESVILDDAAAQGDFTADPYVKQHNLHSVLCTQLVQQGRLNGVIYLENNLTNAAFTRERIDLINLLSGQMAISIENALMVENLEDKVKERTRELREEKDKSDQLLLNILPAETAEELKRTGTSKAKEFKLVTVMFTDFKNFTNMSEHLNAQELVAEINYCYSAFDNIIAQYGIEKIKTIGDSYMCAGGLPSENSTNPVDTLRAALDIRDFMLQERAKRQAMGKDFFEIRIGLHSGPVVAGIVGTRKFAYDIWGDAVNIASRMESSGVPGMVNISGATHALVAKHFTCVHRGMIEAKNKGLVDMYFVESALPDTDIV